MSEEMAGEDAALDAAVAKIMSLGTDKWTQDVSKLDREPQERDAHEQQAETDLDRLEAAQAAGAEEGGEEPAEAEAEAPAFIEIPGGEGEEAEKVPLTEAVEAVKQLRQMQGDIATAVTKAEEEAYRKHDAVVSEITNALTAVRNEARVALEMMNAYMPQAPDPIMLDRNSGYYDPEQYHLARIQYERALSHQQQLRDRLGKAEAGLKTTDSYTDQEFLRREQERAARFIPEFKDEKTLKEALEKFVEMEIIVKAWTSDFKDGRGLRQMWNVKG
ncbi:MAG: hypothetical protein VW362_07405, partial [Candidatus Nanopelagicales bacterium]